MWTTPGLEILLVLRFKNLKLGGPVSDCKGDLFGPDVEAIATSAPTEDVICLQEFDFAAETPGFGVLCFAVLQLLVEFVGFPPYVPTLFVKLCLKPTAIAAPYHLQQRYESKLGAVYELHIKQRALLRFTTRPVCLSGAASGQYSCML